jgi:hypothetical protein
MHNRRPPGFTPAYDAFEAHYADPGKPMVSAFIGVQDRGGDADPQIVALGALLALPDGPDVIEQGVQILSIGGVSRVFMCYWRRPTQFASWAASGPVADWLIGGAEASNEVGRWIEHAHVLPDHLDTLIADPTTYWGLAKLSQAIELTDQHGYWGGTRDRIRISEKDSLDNADGPSLPEPPIPPKGYREIVDVVMPANAVVARGGPDWSKCRDNERAIFSASVHPSFIAGCEYLMDDPAGAGCYAAYIVSESDAHGRASERNHLIAYFVQLSDLERWTRSHPTHIAIHGNFMRMVQQIGRMPDLNLYHEVSVIPAGGLRATYVNCAPETGLLRFGLPRTAA